MLSLHRTRALVCQESREAKWVAKQPWAEHVRGKQRKCSLPSRPVPCCLDLCDSNEALLGPTLISSCSTYSWQWSYSFQLDRLLPAHHLVINICSIWLYSWLNKFSYEKMQLILKGTLILTVHFLLEVFLLLSVGIRLDLVSAPDQRTWLHCWVTATNMWLWVYLQHVVAFLKTNTGKNSNRQRK